jgi:hypothetical protein
MFWQGGFMFYGAIVVPIGTEILGSAKSQAVITRLVAMAINLAGGVTLLAWLTDLFAERQLHWRRRWMSWAFLVVTVIALVVLHHFMDVEFNATNGDFHDWRTFRTMHRWYLRISTMQWAVSILFSFWTLQSWQATDRRAC